MANTGGAPGESAASSHRPHRMQAFEAPSSAFDPHTAPSPLLVQHGFPHRPDPQQESQLTDLWQWAFRRARKVQMIKGDLAVDPVMSQRTRPQAQQLTFGPTGWGGIVISPASLGINQPARMVYAEWRVPQLLPVPSAAETPLTVGFWVGLDGYNPASYELLQAGTAATIVGSNVTYWAWTEWYTTEYQDPPVKVTNFEVQPGDRVSFLVSAAVPTQGLVTMMNYRTQKGVNVGIPARPGISSVGARAAWVVEGVSADLPDFTPMVFTNAAASTQNFRCQLAPYATVTNIGGFGGAVLTQAYVASPTMGVVVWEGLG